MNLAVDSVWSDGCHGLGCGEGKRDNTLRANLRDAVIFDFFYTKGSRQKLIEPTVI